MIKLYGFPSQAIQDLSQNQFSKTKKEEEEEEKKNLFPFSEIAPAIFRFFLEFNQKSSFLYCLIIIIVIGIFENQIKSIMVSILLLFIFDDYYYLLLLFIVYYLFYYY
jgi:hypothetical protein